MRWTGLRRIVADLLMCPHRLRAFPVSRRANRVTCSNEIAAFACAAVLSQAHVTRQQPHRLLESLWTLPDGPPPRRLADLNTIALAHTRRPPFSFKRPTWRDRANAMRSCPTHCDSRLLCLRNNVFGKHRRLFPMKHCGRVLD